jgi:hypothetical protein
LSADIGLENLVDRAKLRWRIERDYQELKQEAGPGHHEGRGWRGIHHQVALCIAAYGLLLAEPAIFPPQDTETKGSSEAVVAPHGHRLAGAATAPRAAYSELHCHARVTAYCRSGRASPAVPLLRHGIGHRRAATQLMQQD